MSRSSLPSVTRRGWDIHTPEGAAAEAETKPPKCLVFDCGGITNSDSGRGAAIRRYVPADKVEEFTNISKEVWNAMKVQSGTTEDEYWAKTIQACPIDPALIDPIKAEIHETLRITYQESLDVLRRAVTRHIPVGMISNHTSWWFKSCAESAKLYDLIPEDLVVVSDQVAVAKPDADIFKIFLRRLEEKHPDITVGECIFVDDKDSNVKAAAALGFIGLRFDAKTANEGDLMEVIQHLGMPLGLTYSL